MRKLLPAAGLAVALVAGGALLAYRPDRPAPTAGARVALAAAWPGAQRADLRGNLRDGPIFQPGIFLDARTSLGTAPTPDGTAQRLVLRAADDSIRELRRRPLSGSPEFGAFAAGGDDLVWTESAKGGPAQIWTAKATGGPARRLTSDTGNAVFYGSQWDLVVADGRVHWAAAADGDKLTEIRSVALTGGTVAVREEPGVWALTAWPWLTNGDGDRSGTTLLRNLAANRDTPVESRGAELITCAPVWCRVQVIGGDGPVGIDLMHPDGSARRRVAGSAAGAALTDVAVLDRFEVLTETGPDSELTGTAGLLVYDLRTSRTVEIATAAAGAFSRGGVLWWPTGDQDALVWHTVDLRTV